MTQFSRPQTARDIFAILDREHQVLVAGDLDSIYQIGLDKEAALKMLASHATPLKAHDLQKIKDLSVRNERLYDAVLRGLREVNNRLKEITAAQSGLQTYGPAGQTKPAVKRQISHERRA